MYRSETSDQLAAILFSKLILAESGYLSEQMAVLTSLMRSYGSDVRIHKIERECFVEVDSSAVGPAVTVHE